MTELPRIFLVDDHRLFLSGVRNELTTDFDIVGEAGDVDDAIVGIRSTNPDVVLLDVHMPGGGGLAVMASVHAERPEVRFLALSVSDAPQDVIAVIRAGARGYVTKNIAPAELRDAIVRVHAGDAVFSPRLAGFVLDAFAAAVPEPVDPELDQLTPREREVLRLIAQGLPGKQIAGSLGISERTVKFHTAALIRKLGADNRAQAVALAAQRGLLE